jgi:hypothetical protein
MASTRSSTTAQDHTQDQTQDENLFVPSVSITMTKRRRFFWAAWWTSTPTHVPFVKPDASDGGISSHEEAKAAAEKRAGMALSILDPLWARAWIRILRGEEAWPSRSSRHPTTSPPTTHQKQEDAAAATSIWSTLGVDPKTVTLTELKAAYRTRVLESHPDQGGTDTEFQRVLTAYAEAQRRLKKPKRKKAE